eukprot:353969-Amorphochlora_amoeboformis.AAC.2
MHQYILARNHVNATIKSVSLQPSGKAGSSSLPPSARLAAVHLSALSAATPTTPWAAGGESHRATGPMNTRSLVLGEKVSSRWYVHDESISRGSMRLGRSYPSTSMAMSTSRANGRPSSVPSIQRARVFVGLRVALAGPGRKGLARRYP